MYTALKKTLTAQELEELENLLFNEYMPDEVMDISALDGCIRALVSSPVLTSGNEMLKWVWDPKFGHDSPNFENIEQVQRIMELIMRHWNDVVQTLRNNPLLFEPLILERKIDNQKIPVIDEWCFGYCTGMRVHQKEWQKLQAKHPEWFKVFLSYGTEAGWDEAAKNPCTEAEHLVNTDAIQENVLHIYHYWRAQPQQTLTTAKIGRNEPCPCGSGKKYKHCHYLIKEGAMPIEGFHFEDEENPPTFH